MNKEKTQNKRGRKPIALSWPDNEFTAREVAQNVKGSLSRVSVHTKINNAVDKGELVIVRKSQSKMGRPHFVYEKAK